MENYILIIGIIAYISLAFISGLREKKKKTILLLSRLENDFGKCANKEYKAERIERISHYYHWKKKLASDNEVWVDDITWNDLDMDMIFKSMNNTYSSAGEEYLYYMLRHINFNTNSLYENDRDIRVFQNDKNIRIAFQKIFAGLGDTGNYSIIDYLDYLGTLEVKKLIIDKLMNILLCVFVIISFWDAGTGILGAIVVCTLQIINYFKLKREIEPYYVCFAYILRLISAGNNIVKCENSNFEKLYTSIQEKLNKLRKIEKKASKLQKTMANMSSNPNDIVMDYVNMILHLDIIKFYKMLKLVSASKKHIYDLLEDMGAIEAKIAIASYREYLPYYSVPEFTEEVVLVNDDLYHPLLERPISNTISTNKSVLITGSNASGKSTFLKAVAINAIFVQTISTCVTNKTKTALFGIYSSISIKDNIEEGDSYYLAEIKSIKRIIDTTKLMKFNVLCFVDEVLRGTNTIERIAASTQILKVLSQGNVICFAATHDIELTNLLDREYVNYHFQEIMMENDIEFDYKIHKGPATSRNAIALLKLLGYDDAIIENANGLAIKFSELGSWV